MSTAPETAPDLTNTAAGWVTDNPILYEGQFGSEFDTGKGKVGDGSTRWLDLAYIAGDDNTGAVISANIQTGTSYTNVAGDAGLEVQMNNAGANTFYADASVMAPGSVLLVRQTGAGQTTVAAAPGTATPMKGGPTLKAEQQGSCMYVRFDTTSTVYVGGEVALT